MSARTRKILALLAILGCFMLGLSHVYSVPFPDKNPLTTTLPQKRPDLLQKKEVETEPEESAEAHGESEMVAVEEEGVSLPRKRSDVLGPREGEPGDEPDLPDEDDEDDQDQEVEELDLPPTPTRAPPPALRKPGLSAEKSRGPSPPETWSEEMIASAKEQCAKLISEKDYDFKALEPIRDGICGAPAPISLKALNLVPKIEIKPAARVTCPLAAALHRWMTEVVQLRAKELLKDSITGITNVASYHCRTRYNDPTQRMSHHAFANALDISEFITQKGERINPLDNWDGDDPRSKFLKEIHAGACKIFGTVLGPEANAAHKNHFHLDMAKRRFSSYCQ